MGPPYRGDSGDRKGELGRVVVDEKGMGNLVGEVEWEVWEMVGRGILVRREAEGNDTRKTAGDVAMGVVARSAGVWENEKVVCACSGKTVWEEREEMRSKGIA